MTGIVAMPIAQPTPSWSATAATSRPSWPTSRHASRRARSVSDARDRIRSLTSDQVRPGHASSAHRHNLLIHSSVTGRPAAGRSRTRTTRRPCGRACTPHARHHACRAVVSTACSSSPSSSDTASSTKPLSPSMAVPALPSRST